VDHYLSNAKSVVQRFFYFYLKRENKNKGTKRKWHRKILLQIQFFAKLFIDGRVRNITYVLGLYDIYQCQSWKYS
jgi:hypothetical protein